ncbi:MAG: decaprenyl-phosphate phosphoribosyltransferase [Actinomycetota bacterium]|nr:decaprenyl-phosphate phosphoribosyltransferase [Actinomycetota bacterium]
MRRESAPEVTTGTGPGGLSPLLHAMRPRQWVKNLLVLAAPLAAGRIGDADVLLTAALAFAVFCAASAAVYLFNDVRDADEDRRHPAKRHRPVAGETLTPATALVASGALAVVATGAGTVIAPGLGVTVAVYLAVQASYTLGLKHQPVIDLACVAAGFLLRAVAGGVASGIVLSPWFVLVASFGSLFIVAGKRFSEIHTLGAAAGTRRSLHSYSESYLRFVWSMAASVTVLAYSLWAFTEAGGPGHVPWAELSVAPFVLGMLRYAVDIDRGSAGAPEDIVLEDRVLQVLGLLWGLTVVLAVYAR